MEKNTLVSKMNKGQLWYKCKIREHIFILDHIPCCVNLIALLIVDTIKKNEQATWKLKYCQTVWGEFWCDLLFWKISRLCMKCLFLLLLHSAYLLGIYGSFVSYKCFLSAWRNGDGSWSVATSRSWPNSCPPTWVTSPVSMSSPTSVTSSRAPWTKSSKWRGVSRVSNTRTCHRDEMNWVPV